VVGVVALVALLPRASLRRRAPRVRHAAPRPAPLERTEWIVEAGRQRSGDVHVRVRPLLREIAAPLLRRQGVRLDAEPERARALLGEELWDLVRPERPLPQDRRGRGLSLAELEQLVQRLEQL
jgi:hypothetical protein